MVFIVFWWLRDARVPAPVPVTDLHARRARNPKVANFRQIAAKCLVFNDGEAAIVRSCQSPLGECHCYAKYSGAQSPGSIEMSHKAEAIERGEAFLKLNILLVGYY
jgi:hypothetical protein